MTINANGAQAILKLGGDATGALGAIKKVHSGVGGLSRSIKNAFNSSIWLGLKAGLASVTAYMGVAYYAAEKQAKSTRRLDNAFKSVGLSYKKYQKEVDQTIRKYQSNSNFGDDEMQASLMSLILMTRDYDKAIKLLPLSMDLATAKGLDLATSGNLIGRAFLGSTMMLKRMGIELPKGVKGMEAMAALGKKINGKNPFGWLTENAEKDILKRYWNELGDFTENVGDIIRKAVNPEIVKATDWLAVLNTAGLEGNITDVIKNGISGAFAAADTIIQGVWNSDGIRDSLMDAFEIATLYFRELVDSVLSKMQTGFEKLHQGQELMRRKAELWVLQGKQKKLKTPDKQLDIEIEAKKRTINMMERRDWKAIGNEGISKIREKYSNMRTRSAEKLASDAPKAFQDIKSAVNNANNAFESRAVDPFRARAAANMMPDKQAASYMPQGTDYIYLQNVLEGRDSYSGLSGQAGIKRYLEIEMRKSGKSQDPYWREIIKNINLQTLLKQKSIIAANTFAMAF